jgi:hypothetical protein
MLYWPYMLVEKTPLQKWGLFSCKMERLTDSKSLADVLNWKLAEPRGQDFPAYRRADIFVEVDQWAFPGVICSSYAAPVLPWRA